MDPTTHTHADQQIFYTPHVQPSNGFTYPTYYAQEQPYVIAQPGQNIMMPMGASQQYLVVNQPQPVYPPHQQYYTLQPQPQVVYYTQPQEVFVQPQPILTPKVKGDSTTAKMRPLSTSTPLPPAVCPASRSFKSGKYRMDFTEDRLIEDISRISVNDTAEDTLADSYERSRENSGSGRLPVPSNYKTRLCAQFSEEKHCDHGSSCRFAHGTGELRASNKLRPMNHNKYKTRLCKHFLNASPDHKGNYCPYGHRCEFIHPTDREFALLPTPVRTQLSQGSLGLASSNDVTPEAIGDYPPFAITRSAMKPGPEKVLLKNRNIAGSMMNLASGRRPTPTNEAPLSSAYSCVSLARMPPRHPSTFSKFSSRRRSQSQFNVKRCKSSEALS